METYEHISKFAKGDIVILKCGDYRDIKKGTIGVVTEPTTQWKYLMTVHIDGETWSFRENEFDLIA